MSTSTSSASDLKRYEAEEQIYEKPAEFKDEGISKTQILVDVLKQLKNGGDLYRIALPAALLAPVSMLEYSAQYLAPHDYVLNLHKMMDPEQRFINVLKWWLSNLTSTPKKSIMHAKPYNAILGEVFRCKYIHEESKTFYIAEQVSHHPPISGIYLANREKNFSVTATLKPKSKFHGNSTSTLLEGEILLYLHNFDEKYVIDFPWILARGLILGTQCLEVYEHLKINCPKTGFSASVEFKSNTGNPCEGKIQKGGKDLYTLSGLITEKVTLKNLGTKKSFVLVDAAQIPKVTKWVVPVAKQSDNESRRVWHKVTYAIKKADYMTANEEKHTVEQAQRVLRAKRQETGEKWSPKYFKHIGNDKYACNFFRDGVYDQKEPSFETLDIFKVSEAEIAFIKKHCPNQVSLSKYVTNGSTTSINGSTTSISTLEDSTESEESNSEEK